MLSFISLPILSSDSGADLVAGVVMFTTTYLLGYQYFVKHNDQNVNISSFSTEVSSRATLPSPVTNKVQQGNVGEQEEQFSRDHSSLNINPSSPFKPIKKESSHLDNREIADSKKDQLNEDSLDKSWYEVPHNNRVLAGARFSTYQSKNVKHE